MSAEGLLMLKAGFETAQAANEYLSSLGKKDFKLHDGLCKALRTLYFTPNGVLSLLRVIARGEDVPTERLSQRLINFNDPEWEVRDALNSIDFDRLSKELRLTLSTTQAFSAIRNGKMSLRRDIQAEINYYGQRNVKPNTKAVDELIQGIESLNAEIERLEAAVNLRARTN